MVDKRKKVLMKKLALMALAVMAIGGAIAQEVALATARSQITQALESADVMAQLFKGLSAQDQVTFLSEVNAAIEKMPASNDEKAAKYLAVNKVALQNVKKGNSANLLAEMVATVPPEYLTILNERVASDLLKRTPGRYTDEQYVSISKAVLAAVRDRLRTANNPEVRETFAILMFVNASNGTPAGLADTLAADMANPQAKEMAMKEWLPAALGVNQARTYDPLLGAADAGEQPNAPEEDPVSPRVIAAPSEMGMLSVLADLAGVKQDTDKISTSFSNLLINDPNQFGLPPAMDNGLSRIPVDEQIQENHRGDQQEPGGYPGQGI